MENCVNRTCGKFDTSIRYHCKLPTNEVPLCKKHLTEKPKPVAKLACSDLVMKPCPFCGKTPTLHNSHFRYSIMHTCDAVKSVGGLGKKRDVIALWNERAL